MAVITYIGGFCTLAALKKLPCEYCAMNITSEDREIQLDRNVLIGSLSRGALKFPQPTVIKGLVKWFENKTKVSFIQSVCSLDYDYSFFIIFCLGIAIIVDRVDLDAPPTARHGAIKRAKG